MKELEKYLSKSNLEKFNRYSMQQVLSKASDVAWCPDPTCGMAFLYDESRDDCHYVCLKCNKNYCLKCRIDYHYGLTCEEQKTQTAILGRAKKQEEEAKLDQDFQAYALHKNMKQCSQCKFWVEKSEGCNHMTCRCKYEFCYACGGPYQRCVCVQYVNQVPPLGPGAPPVARRF